MAAPDRITPNCNYPTDPNFPDPCTLNLAAFSNQIYCCTNNSLESDFAFCNDIHNTVDDTCTICAGDNASCSGCTFSYPYFNVLNEPMLKGALRATAKSAWVKTAFQQYDSNNKEDPVFTASTITTMGNKSECGLESVLACDSSADSCEAVVKAFQYGWGTSNQGNKCKLTILDIKGSTFSQWVQRMGMNPEADASPVGGKYKVKVQFGWYITGGNDMDVCGQPSGLPNTQQPPGTNSSYILASPVMWFLVQFVNVHFENGKFIYEIEGIDTLQRGQESMITHTWGNEQKPMYFTRAVELLGRNSFPPFRVQFKQLDPDNKVVDMQFVRRPGALLDRQSITDNTDCQGWGPFDIWEASTKSPLDVITTWYKVANAVDLTGKNSKGLGITLNYDPVYKFVPPQGDCPNPCSAVLPQYGMVTLWAGTNPYGNASYTDAQMNNRMKAVYIVNGGNCSPVLSFAPSFKYNVVGAQAAAAQRAGGSNTTWGGKMVNQLIGMVRTRLAITSSTGPIRNRVVVRGRDALRVNRAATGTQVRSYNMMMANLLSGAIEAELRVEGDPSDWMCTPGVITGCNGVASTSSGSTVGIIFINPQFLINGQGVADCPGWATSDPADAEFRSICNELLTNKGWQVMGIEHQFKDGSYTTTLKLKLIATNSELSPAQMDPVTLMSIPTRFGGWDLGPVAAWFTGVTGALKNFLRGATAASWTPDTSRTYIGGGLFGSSDGEPDSWSDTSVGPPSDQDYA